MNSFRQFLSRKSTPGPALLDPASPSSGRGGDGVESTGDGKVPPSEVPRSAAARANGLVAARREFTDQFAHLAKGKRNWQIVAFIALAMFSTVTLAYVGLATSARVRLVAFEVDELGQVRAFREVADVYAAGAAVTDATLRLFVRDLRTVYQDPAATQDLITGAYAFADASTQEWLNGYFSDPENDPRLLMRRLSRRVDVKGIIRIPESDSWKLSWVEVETPLGTSTQRRAAWEAYITVEQVPEAASSSNPLGLFVTAINWAPVSKQQ